VRGVAELHAGCVAGAIDREAYVRMLEDAGFAEVRVVEEKIVDVPDDALEGIVDLDVVRAYRESGGALLSVTVVGWKPGE
jgi:hypothetical protein